MRKNLMKVAVLAGLGLVGQLAATDFRAPIATQMGPLHYSFDKLHKKKSNFTYFTTAHFRETEDAFMKHGTETHPLAQLIFGKESFTIGESFAGASAVGNGYTENYNPYLDLVKIAPRVSYSEAGVFFGAKWDYPVWNNKGRIGIRGSLPIRWVRMERDNEAEGNAVGLQDQVVKGDMRYVQPFDANAPKDGVISRITSYKLGLLNRLKYINTDGYITSYVSVAPAGQVTMGGVYNQADTINYGKNPGSKIPFVLIKSNKAGEPPFHQGGALLVKNGIPQDGEDAGTTIRYMNSEVDATNNYKLSDLPADGTIADGNKAYAFVTGQDYTNIDEDNLADVWATTINGANGQPIATSENQVNFVDDLLSYYNSDVEYWLKDQGFVMATDEQTGLGDIPVEVFYQHSFNDKWNGELCLGVKFPTGNGGSDYAGNPYRVQMGNGSHWEIKIGAFAAWQAIRCMNVKLDLSYNFALEDTEYRKASYKGATIKNFGPSAAANVDWGYFIGNLDFNFTHPKSKKINGMIGYQLYYKTEDHIDFKDKDQLSWLGKTWTDAAGHIADEDEFAGTQWSDVNMTLDSHVARMGTESWGHRVRLEGSYNLSKYCTTSVGGLYTFAGQNLPVDADVHCACQIRF
ncbi:MAG: hypothetical protein WC192_04165 [Candidatus Babeliales bacterium]|jgi:hypothetical protein